MTVQAVTTTLRPTVTRVVPPLHTMLDPALLALLSADVRARIMMIGEETVEVPMLEQHMNPALMATLSDFHVERIREIDSRDYTGFWLKAPGQYTLMGVLATPEFLARALLALKMYYVVALLDPRNRHAVGALADPAWHADLLDSPNVGAMCDLVFGQTLHHTILDHTDDAAVARVSSDYLYTLDVYGRLFTWFDQQFFPSHIADAELLCGHNKVRSPDVWDHGLYAENIAA